MPGDYHPVVVIHGAEKNQRMNHDFIRQSHGEPAPPPTRNNVRLRTPHPPLSLYLFAVLCVSYRATTEQREIADAEPSLSLYISLLCCVSCRATDDPIPFTHERDHPPREV